MSSRISAPCLCIVALGSVLVTSGSCARETPGYCAFEDGNATCDASYTGTFCIFQGPHFLEHTGEEYRNVDEAQRLGCYESRPMTPEGADMSTEDYLCVPKGLMVDDHRKVRKELRALKRGEISLRSFLRRYGVTKDEQDNGCVPELGTTTGTTDSGSTTVGTESSTTGEGGTSTTGPECTVHEDCQEPARPLCDPESNECVTCDAFGADGDGKCAERYPMAPLCVDGACVQCTEDEADACTGNNPVCDNNTCAPCTAHDQCGDAACNLFTGACLPANAVVHVGGMDADFDSIAAAVTYFDSMETDGTIIVHTGDYNNQPVTIDGDRVLAFLAEDLEPMATPPRWTQAGGESSPQLTVKNGATVLMDGLQLSGNATNRGLWVDGGNVWVDRSRIVQNSGGGVLAENGAQLRLRNCFVGSGGNTVVLEAQGATADVLYSTLGAGWGPTTGLGCNAAATVTVRNSLIVSSGIETDCANLDAAYSASQMQLPGTGNINLDFENFDWFANFDTGDFHLHGMFPAGIDTAAQWTTGDPTTDIDGDPRPTDGIDYVGADIP